MGQRDRFIDLCDATAVSAEVFPCAWRAPKNQQAIVRMHPTGSRGLILLGDDSPAKADVGTVQVSSSVDLQPGDIVAVRPYSGATCVEFGSVPGIVKIFGGRGFNERLHTTFGDTLDWDVLMRYEGGQWVPLFGWQILKRDPHPSPFAIDQYLMQGTVERGTWKGKRAAMYDCDKDRSLLSAFMLFGLDGLGEGYLLAHEDYLLEFED